MTTTGVAAAMNAWLARNPEALSSVLSPINALGGIAGGVADLAEARQAAHEGDYEKTALKGGKGAVTTAAGGVGMTAALAAEGTAQAINATAAATPMGVAAAGVQMVVGGFQVYKGTTERNATQQVAEEAATADYEGAGEVKDVATSVAETANATAYAGKENISEGTANMIGASILIELGLTNPVGLGVLAVAGLIAGGMVIWKRLDQRAEGIKLVQDNVKSYEAALALWNMSSPEEKQISTKPILDEKYDVSKWGSMPWDRGYGTIFREEEAEAKTELAKTLWDATQIIPPFDEKDIALQQIVVNMGYKLDDFLIGKPTEAQIFKHLG
jgi:hypothetical protein